MNGGPGGSGDTSTDVIRNTVVGGKYKLLKKIGSGSFGQIYEAEVYNPESSHRGERVAIKLEDVSARNQQLHYESKVYKILQNGSGIPRAYDYRTEGQWNVLVVDLLGPSLEDLFNFCSRQFSLKTVLMLADQMLHRIEFVHSRSFIHRDIKPDNFLMGLGNYMHKCYIIDFGLAKKFRNAMRAHIQYRDGKNLTGTARYASINAHVGCEQSRRDDLESLGYVLMYFMRGELPWQGLRAANKKQKYERICEKKQGTCAETLCKDSPDEFTRYIHYTRNLKFEESPDYAYCRRIFREVAVRNNFLTDLTQKYDHIFDWTTLQHQRGQGSQGSTTTPARQPGTRKPSSGLRQDHAFTNDLDRTDTPLT